MYRLLAIAKYDERYVIPSAHVEDAHRLEELATDCSVSAYGGGDSPFGADSGRGGPVPIAIQTRREIAQRQTADSMGDPSNRAEGLTQ